MGRKKKKSETVTLVEFTLGTIIVLLILIIILAREAPFLLFLIIVGIIAFFYYKQKRRLETKRKIQLSNINEIDTMNGHQFEHYLKHLLEGLGYEANVTPGSGDYGADLVVKKDNQKIVVQAKRYAKKVNLKAVQEIAAAKPYYKADSAWVITNNYFLPSAINLANSTDVKLINRDDLIDMIVQMKDDIEKKPKRRLPKLL